MGTAEIRYVASTGGIDIAYQVVCDGPVDLAFVPGFVSHPEVSWELLHFAWLQQLEGPGLFTNTSHRM